MGLREEVDEIKAVLEKGGVEVGKRGNDLHNKAMKEVIARLDSIEEVIKTQGEVNQQAVEAIKTLAERMDAMDLEPEDDDPDGEEG